jgi:hypothetical protein
MHLKVAPVGRYPFLHFTDKDIYFKQKIRGKDIVAEMIIFE